MFFDKCRGSILGLACGDALGVPVETMNAEEILERYGYIDKLYPSPPDHRFPEVRNLPAGSTSDDTQLARAIMRAVINSGGSFDMDAVAREHVKELEQAYSRGWGRSTRRACARLKNGVHWSKSAEPNGGGNGVMMKIAPLGLMHALTETGKALLISRATELGQMTHGDPAAVVAGIVHAAVIKELAEKDFRGNSKKELLSKIGSVITQVSEHAESHLGDKDRKISTMWSLVLDRNNKMEDDAPLAEIARLFNADTSKAFYAVDSFGLSYFLFIRQPFSFKAVFNAVNAGGDTDTNAAVIGSLVGALNGSKIIPENILSGLEARDEIETQITKFIKKVLSRG